MYIAIRRYQTDPKTMPEVTRRVREGFVPIICQVPGFVAYYWVDAGNGVGFSVNIYEDKAGADASIAAAADFRRKDLAELLLAAPAVTAGDVLIEEHAA
jgi:hypothetical protein